MTAVQTTPTHDHHGGTVRTYLKPIAALLAIATYVGSVIAANWATTRYGFVPVGFGEVATAGTFAAGAALVVRDFVQDLVGRAAAFALIMAAGLLSYAISAEAIATASLAAFLVSETLDMAVYTPLRNRARFGDRRWALAVAAAAIVGAVADTVVFLRIAFGWPAVQAGITGQLIGKAAVVAAVIAIGLVSRAAARRRV